MPVLRTLARIWTALLALAALTLGSSLVARWLLPATPWIAAPTLTTSTPVDGDLDVLPRSKVVLNFSVPMNRSSTQYALQISPATEGNFYWSADSRQLTFTPATTLEPDTEYILNIGSAALGRWWQPIVTARTIHFHTAPLPAVIAALPSASGTPVDGSLAIIFSQAMVPADQINLPAALPQIQIDPPTSTQQRWLSQNTLLIQPDTPLRAATHYTATITADLTDLRGVDLGQPFSWNWSTAWPEPRGFTPSANAHWVSPHQPLVLTLSSPVDEALLRSTLSINPPTEGNLSTALIGASQVVTFTPQLGWEYGRSYQVHLATSDPSLAAPPALIWQFSVEPKPGLLAFFPGQGQSLQAGQEVRLIFSTPMDEASLRSGLKIEPPVNDLPLQVNETEVRLRPDLQPSTTYTLTIAADTPDRSGEPLGITPTVQLRAASAEPALRIPPTSAHVISLPVKQTARITLERINLTRLDLSLYKLDTPAVVRAMSLKPNEWRDFSPERYGQSLSRSWSLPLSDPTDTLVRDPITVEIADNTSLPPGIYYLRVISHEGPRADLLLQVSSVVLTLRQSDSQVLVWATDKVSGAPVTDLPIRLYAGEALITRGQTGPDGIWEQPIQRPDRSAPYVVLADDSSPALVRGDWLAAPKNDHTPDTRSLIFLNQPSYVPDDSVHIGGIARQFASDGSLILPDAHTTCRMLFEAGGSTTLSQNTACLIDTSGIVSGTMRLPPHQPPGDYHLQVQVGDSTTALTVHVTAETSPNRLSFSEAGGQLRIHADQAGLPLSGATISWTLHLEPLAAPSNTDGFVFGADLPPPEQIDGSGITDPGGQLVVPLPTGKFTGALLHYQIRAELRIADELLAIGQHEGDSFPTDSRVGLRLPSRIVQSNERASVELLTLSANSSPAPNKPMNVSVYRSGNLDGTPLIVRKATSDTQGRATVQLVQLRPGAYTIVAKTGDSTSSTELWVAGRRYTGWQNAPGQVGVIADRDSYRPGDVAHLLVTAPYAKAHLLLTTERGKVHSAEVRDIQASQLITLTITPEMAPAISIGAVIAAGSERLVGATAIRVADNQPVLHLEITSDSPHYAPDSTALLHITTSLAGVPTPTTLMVTLDPAGSPSGEPALARFTPPLPNPLETAMLQIHQQPPMDSRPISGNRLTLSGAVGHMLVQTEVDGQAVLRVPLPNSSGSWRISTYAIAGTGHLATASITVTTRLPLDLTPDAPPILRPDDQSEVGLLVNNTSTITQSLKLRLQATDGTINQSTPPERTLILAPGEAQRIAWMVSPRPEASAVNLRFTASGADLNNHETLLLPVEAAPLAATQELHIVGSGDLTTTLPFSLPTEGEISVAIAPGVWVTLADSATQLAALPARSIEQRASLLLISAVLAHRAPDVGGTDWAVVARRAADELGSAQNSDGGWGWWPGMPSQAFVTGFVIESQQIAHEAIESIAAPEQQALAYLAQASSELTPDVQAYLLYVRSRTGTSDTQAASALHDAELSAAGLAYVALALPTRMAAPVLDRLLATGQATAESSTMPQISWAAAHSTMPHNQTATNAAVVQALYTIRPLATERTAALRGMLMGWGVDGWPSAFSAARVAAALASQSPEPGGPRLIQLGNTEILNYVTPITSTLRLQTPAIEAGGSTTLRISADQPAHYLIALRTAASPASPTDTTPAAISLYQEYLDPQSGAPISADSLHVGQQVAVHIILISTQPILRGSLEIALPATFQPAELELHAPFIYADLIDNAARTLRIETADMPPGVYNIRVLTRATTAGRYSAPGARLILADEGLPPIMAPANPPLTISDK